MSEHYNTNLRVSIEGFSWLREQSEHYHTGMLTLLRILVVDALVAYQGEDLPQMPDDGHATLQIKLPESLVEQAGGREEFRNLIRFILDSKAGLIDAPQKKSEPKFAFTSSLTAAA